MDIIGGMNAERYAPELFAEPSNDAYEDFLQDQVEDIASQIDAGLARARAFKAIWEVE